MFRKRTRPQPASESPVDTSLGAAAEAAAAAAAFCLSILPLCLRRGGTSGAPFIIVDPLDPLLFSLLAIVS